ncbi:MAG: 50S ribosomal protein L29 [Patescibacteria group bacterium]|nr:50S ribosomal protein L29 [Patescibacteria group bacterium]
MAKTEKNILQDLRSKDIPALDKDIATAAKKLGELRSQLAVGKLTNHAAINKLRKDIARMQTLKGEKIILKEIQG